MSDYYIPRRTKNLFDPSSSYPFKISRSKLDMFLNCPRCFYMDRRLGVGQPPGFPFNLNSAVDFLLKKEFDVHRAKGEPHPLMKHYGIEAVPFAHSMLDVWRENFKGIEVLHQPSHLILGGAVDDVWQTTTGELIIVDYKSTAKDGEVSLDAEWQIGYKRQMEVYQWLFRQNGFNVSKVGYFVYCNGKRDKEAFDAKLEFGIKLIPYEGDDSWIPDQLIAARGCLMGEIPAYGKSCDFCNYRKAAGEVEGSGEKVVVRTSVTQVTAVKKKVVKKVPQQGSTLF